MSNLKIGTMKTFKRIVLKNRIFIGIYLLWIFFHIISLVISFNEGQAYRHQEYTNDGTFQGKYTDVTVNPKQGLWPFAENSHLYNYFKKYDISEFIFYVFTPIIIYIAGMLIFGKKKLE